MDKKRLRFQKGDVLAAVVVLSFAAAVFAAFSPKAGNQDGYAEIYRNGEMISRVSLCEDQTFTLTGRYSNVITVSQGMIAITESDCPGGDCVRCGFIGAGGRSLVCLPNGVEIRIVTAEPEVDFVVG